MMNDIEMQSMTIDKKTSSLTKEEIVNQQLEEVKGTMNKNVHQVLDNIDLTNDLEKKTEEMRGLSKEFSVRSTQAKRKMWYRNVKTNICIAFLLVIVFYIVYENIH